MAIEIELKLRLPFASVRHLLAHPFFASQPGQKNRLLNTYYDTPEFDLRKRGIALRLRRKGWALWLMTVKGGDAGVGGLAQRSEREAPTQPGVFDFSIVTDAGLREFLERHHSRLLPVFTTDFTRTAWTIDLAGSRIEVALDRGRINALQIETTSGERKPVGESICELELELLQGESPDALFDLAIALAADIHLLPEIRSKAERGYALADPSLSKPVKGFVSPVDSSMSPVDAFRAIALASLAHLQRNEAGGISGEDPEYVHQCRVAIRRLRSAFKLFSPVLSSTFVAVYAPRWKALAANLGGARDWDVFLSETLVPLEEAFPDDAGLALLRSRGKAAQTKAQSSAGASLSQPTYSQLLLAFSAALFRVEAPTIAGNDKPSASSLHRFAVGRLKKRGRTIARLAREHKKMRAECRHKLRIECKKLRYAIEFFAPILSEKRISKYQLALSRIQDRLGALNDLATALRLIGEIHPGEKPNPLILGWITGRNELLVKEFESELRHFLACKAPCK